MTVANRSLITKWFASACVAAVVLATAGCGGVGNEVAAAAAAQNTLLTIAASPLPKILNAGTARTFSVTVTDVNGIASVLATLDGLAITITNSGSTYSITIPATLAPGDHTLTISGSGKAPDGTVEVPQSVTFTFTVMPNTTAQISGFPAASHYTVGTAQLISPSVIDPNGISSVTATLDAAAIAVTQTASVYSVTLPATLAVGMHTLVYSVTGLNPDGTPEPTQTFSQSITVYPVNTPLVISSVTGPTAYTVGTAQTYTAIVVDPDLVASVVATVNGNSVPVTFSAPSSYSITLPASTPVGTYVLVLTATGTQPDGTLEPPHVVTLNITVYPPNTPLAIGPMTVVPGVQLVGTTAAVYSPSTYSVTVVDPDGIASVTALFYAVDMAVIANSPAPIAPPPVLSGSLVQPAKVTQTAPNVYTISVPEPFQCQRYIEFTAVGLNPDGTPEPPQVLSLDTTNNC